MIKAHLPLAPYWWLGGTTCHHHTSVAWTCQNERYVLLKHSGHSEWCGGYSGNQYCETYYCLFDLEVVGDNNSVWSKPDLTLAKWTGRWTKAKQERMEILCNPWK